MSFSDEWVKARDSVETALSHGWRNLLNAFHPIIDQVGKDLAGALPVIAEAALAAAVHAAGQPGDESKAESAYQAAKGAAFAKATELGVKEANTFVLSIRATSLNAAALAVNDQGKQAPPETPPATEPTDSPK